MRAHRAKRRRRGGEDDCLDLQFELPVEDPPLETEYSAQPVQEWKREEEARVAVQESVWAAEAQTEWPVESVPAHFSPLDLTEAPIMPEVREPLPPFPRIKPIERKVIEFPRFEESAFSSRDELAEPIGDQLRIFEAVEEFLAPEPSHLADIRLEPAEPEDQTEAAFDLPLPVAALARRSVANAIDAGVFAVGFMAFAASAFTLARPILFTKSMTLASLGCVSFLFGIYQLMFLCYAKATPGMRAAGLEICGFSGAPPARSLRIARAIALLLSCAALGLGLLWAFLDEDGLGWHDRITHTYLRER